MAYIVDRELPKYCNKCHFGVVKSSLPLSDGTHSYQCKLKTAIEIVKAGGIC